MFSQALLLSSPGLPTTNLSPQRLGLLKCAPDMPLAVFIRPSLAPVAEAKDLAVQVTLACLQPAHLA